MSYQGSVYYLTAGPKHAITVFFEKERNGIFTCAANRDFLNSNIGILCSAAYFRNKFKEGKWVEYLIKKAEGKPSAL